MEKQRWAPSEVSLEQSEETDTSNCSPRVIAGLLTAEAI